MISKIEPTQPPMFQIAWESTLKCNLDCSYCGDGHDNRQAHPSLEDSLKTVDFIVAYVDRYMQNRPQEQRIANLNIQGGESIYHPNIIEILEYANSRQTNYKLYVNLITNAVASPKLWSSIASLVNYFTISYHAESLDWQREQVRDNILHLQSLNKAFHVAVLMHPDHWEDCINMIEWCAANNIPHHKRQIDHAPTDTRFNYTSSQAEFISPKKIIPIVEERVDLSSQGRDCCGGLELCTNESSITKYIPGNNFEGWHCSVNQYFLYIRQSTGEIFTNKDCKMNYNGTVGPIGNLNNVGALLNHPTITTIVCKKPTCWCGLCAPKARDEFDYTAMMQQYWTTTDQSPL
jgi:pyruvate-formate lyase-activating enzyme